eukprot:CAMPEP_0118941938 /NCGR_PEP_ID=MMETSP1169-20130426/35013_1 /TAXON_ID=36882 /ORGANISM="Pyramimonas obovata, Strain CCMP722" /LENGTH=514 /DNA_ID=CAMNT_0006886837 /DNA_START=341 /DNA_END=1885 /DNA_ORIENTATION=-
MPPQLPGKALGASGTIVTHCTGGLNQQRFQVVTSAVVARLANAALEDPQLNTHKAWNDASKLSDIFDVPFLREKLASIVKFAPDDDLKPSGKVTPPIGASAEWWQKRMPAVLTRVHKVEIPSLYKRLNVSYYSLPQPARYLWCYVNFHALKFVDKIEELATRLHDRLGGKYVAVHMRLEEDMLSKLGPACLPENMDNVTKMELAEQITTFAKEVWGEGWKGLDPKTALQRGKCPMTERQVIEVLLALGLSTNSTVYVAGGTPHPVFTTPNSTVEFLREEHPQQAIPKVVRKEDILTVEEHNWLKDSPSKMAALDYLLSLYSDVFVRTIGGNMGHSLSVHRSYLGRYTLQPNKQALWSIAEGGWRFGMRGFFEEVRDAHPGTDLRWMHSPMIRKGMYRYRYVDERVDASIVALGIDHEAKHCLCKEGNADRDTALYRNSPGSVASDAGNSARPSRTNNPKDRQASPARLDPEDQAFTDAEGEAAWDSPENVDSLHSSDEDDPTNGVAESDIDVLE